MKKYTVTMERRAKVRETVEASCNSEAIDFACAEAHLSAGVLGESDVEVMVLKVEEVIDSEFKEVGE